MLKDSNICGLGYMVAVWSQNETSNIGKTIGFFLCSIWSLLHSEKRCDYIAGQHFLFKARVLCLMNRKQTFHCKYTSHNFTWRSSVMDKAQTIPQFITVPSIENMAISWLHIHPRTVNYTFSLLVSPST